MDRHAYLAAIAATTIVAGSGVLAQTATTSLDATTKDYVEIEDGTMLVGPFNISVDELDEFDVIGPDGEKIGEVEKVLADASGIPIAVVVETEGFLGIGDEDVVVALDQLQLVEADLQVEMTEEELEALPKWED